MEDDRGFTEWYRASYASVLAGVVARASSPADARDAVDEAFSRAAARWPRVSRMSSPSGWTYTVALNVLKREHRRSTRESRGSIAAALAPAESWIDDNSVADLIQLFSTLSPREREVAALIYVLDCSTPIAAELLRVSVSTVTTTLANARARLRQQVVAESGSAGTAEVGCRRNCDVG